MGPCPLLLLPNLNKDNPPICYEKREQKGCPVKKKHP